MANVNKVSNLAISLLQPTMKTLCLRIKQLVQEKPGVDHYDVYHKVCEEFDLYDEQGAAPIWLSRVVEGIMRDIDDREFKV